MRLKLKGNNCVYNYPVSDWQWENEKVEHDYHVKSEDKVDESQKSQWKYESEVYLNN